MQFSVLAVFTLLTAAMAGPVKRQSSRVTVETAAMTDKEGNVVEFDTAGVYQANKDAGLKN